MDWVSDGLMDYGRQYVYRSGTGLVVAIPVELVNLIRSEH